jgi:hypothetical protein
MKQALGWLAICGLLGGLVMFWWLSSPGQVAGHSDTHFDTYTGVHSRADFTESKVELRTSLAQFLQPRVSPPSAPDGKSSNWYYSKAFVVPEDMTIAAFSVEMEGGTIDMLHHARVILPDRAPIICVNNPEENQHGYEIYAVSRNTTDPMDLPDPYGIPLNQGERMQIEFMEHTRAHPHSQHAQHSDIKPSLLITLHRDDSRSIPVEYMRVRLDDSSCQQPSQHQAFSVPTSTESILTTSESTDESAGYIFPASGEIVLAGANFWPQKGGRQVSAYIDNELVHTFYADDVANVEPWQQNIPHMTDVVSFDAGAALTIAAEYQNPFDTPVLDASGMFGFYFMQDQ